MSLFFYYPLGGAGSGASALSIEVTPNPAESYIPQAPGHNDIGVNPHVSGGVPPYTVSWSFFSGSTKIVPSSYTGANISFSAFYNGSSGQIYTADWEATATDSVSNTASTIVTITLGFSVAPP